MNEKRTQGELQYWMKEKQGTGKWTLKNLQENIQENIPLINQITQKAPMPLYQ